MPTTFRTENNKCDTKCLLQFQEIRGGSGNDAPELSDDKGEIVVWELGLKGTKNNGKKRRLLSTEWIQRPSSL